MDKMKCLSYATQKHDGQTRKNGVPYISHPVVVAARLSDKGYDDNYIITGLFHDLLEDTDATEKEILELSNEQVLKSVKLLTKTGDPQYIDKILEDPIAKAVKNEDRIHNLQCACDATPDFVEKYLKDTKEKFIGKFSEELDQEYERLAERFVNWEQYYEYTTDASLDPGPIFRTEKSTKKSWIANGKGWVETDPFFWADIGDNAKTISQGEVIEMMKS